MNVFTSSLSRGAALTSKGTASRRAILDAALALFRERGYDETTMRDIAAAVGLSPGAAYRYFPSKDALVLAYYAEQEEAHAAAALRALARSRDIRERILAVIVTKLDLLKEDRRLLGTLFRSVGDPGSPLSVFSSGTREVRAAALALFAEAVHGADPPLPPPIAEPAGPALWLLHLGCILYWLHDESPAQQHTRPLVEGAATVVTLLLRLASQPMFAPMLGALASTMREAGLLV